jgi:RHS repeat-associated protein
MRLTQVLQWTAAVTLASILAPAALAVNTSRVEYYHHDALGNVRVVTDETGQVLERHDYLPFGEECTTGACAANPGLGSGQPRKFTGKERDQETGLDYFGARYYGSRIGRFTSIDPVYTWRENLIDPQRWNRYAYGRNNPLRYVDPDGRIINDAALQNNAQYQQWKGQYLSQPGAAGQWDALNNDPGITVNVSWDTKGTKSVTDGYVWDSSSGKLTAVNVTFAAKTGSVSNAMDAQAGYVYGSTISDSKERHAYVFAHELAHVEYAQTPGAEAALKQRDQDVAFLQQQRQQLGLRGYTSSPQVASTQQRMEQGARQRETAADLRASNVLEKKP